MSDIEDDKNKESLEDTGTENPTRDVAIVGESAGGSTQISMQVLQNIYNEITGGTEELNKGYDKDFQIEFTDLEQLNYKFEQIVEQYHIESKNCSVKIYHLDDTRETFSSFERFRIYNKSSTSPVESILIKYNFLIVLPKTRKPQSYTISVRVASRVAIIKKMRSDEHVYPRPILRLMRGQTAMVSIDYVDYAVARNFLILIEGWFDCLNVGSSPYLLKLLRRKSEYVTTITKYALGGLSVSLIYERLPLYLPQGGGDFLVFGKLILAGFVAIFVAYQVGKYLGQKSEYTLDELTELSFVKINKGDEKLIEEVKKDNRKTIIKAAAHFLVAVVIGVIASVIANTITA